MRISTIVALPLLALIGFGYFLSHSISTSRELLETREQLAQIQAAHQALELQYQTLVQEKNSLAAQAEALRHENADLHEQVTALGTQRQALASQIEPMRTRLALLEEANPLLTQLLALPAGQLAAFLLVPMLPLSIGAVYVMVHAKTSRNKGPQTEGTFQAALTREELQWIARRRRQKS